MNPSDAPFIYEDINPWKSIWLHPRKTLRHIAGLKGESGTRFLPILAGLTFTIPAGIQLMAMAPVLGLLLCVSGLFLGPWVIRLSAFFLFKTGRWFGGQADRAQLRTVMAWVNVPMLPAWILGLLILIFKKQFPSLAPFAGLAWVPFMPVWALCSFCIAVGGTAEVQKFSLPRSLGSLFLTQIFLTLLGWACLILFTVTVVPFVNRYREKSQQAESVRQEEAQQKNDMGQLLVPADEKGPAVSAYRWIQDQDLIEKYEQLTGEKYPRTAQGSLGDEDRRMLETKIKEKVKG